MTSHVVTGGGGTRLHVAEHGDPGGRAILFIHGWSQCELCWRRQYEAEILSDFRMIGLDLRGHGRSEKPDATEAYTDNELWAADVAAVLGDLGLDAPILVGWSYGGLVIADYLRRHGRDGIGGVNFVSAAVPTHGEVGEPTIGPGLMDHVPGASDDDLATSIAAIRAFLGGMTAAPLEAEDYETFLAFNMLVPPHVRAALLKRDSAPDWRLDAIDAPVLVSHGSADRVVLPPMSRYAAERCRNAEVSWYEGIGHAPFMEAADRFNDELAAFARAV